MNEEPRPIEDARLKSLRIEGFKCFADTTIPLGRLTVLAGGNSVGKSSVIQALLLLRSAWPEFSAPVRYPHHVVGKTDTMAQIPLNDNFLMQLGSSHDVVTNGKAISEILLSVEYDQDLIRTFHFNVSIEKENYLTFTSIDAFINPNVPPLEIDNGLRFPQAIRIYDFYYLNAERIGPRPVYDMSGRNNRRGAHIFDSFGRNKFEIGWQGEHTVQVLSSNLYDRLDVEKEKSFENSTNLKLGAQVNSWMNYIIPGTNLNARKLDEINKSIARINNYSPNNVGFGISYVLPIVVSGLLAEGILIVENPEAHLHPSGQSRIGQFLAQVASAGVQVVVETHSEHVLNGIRIATMKGVLQPDDVAINFFQRNADTENVEIQQIGINSMGDFTEFPTGFFDQVEEDLIQLTKIRRNIK